MDYIVEDLRPLAVELDSVYLDPANARTGHAIDRIAASLSTYGQRTPIVVNRSQGNKVEKGNGTWKAAKSLGWGMIAAVFVEDDPTTAAGYGIADNRTGDLSTWEPDALQAILDSIDPDLELPTGFETWELDALLERMGAKEIDTSDFDQMAEWEGMPEFKHEDKTDEAAFTIRVFLKDDNDLEEFGKLLDRDLKGRKFIWFSKQPIGDTYEAR